MSGIQATLDERGKRYGAFDRHAKITQALKALMMQTTEFYPHASNAAEIRIQSGWALLSESQKEALEMIAHKIGRILNGDPNYMDSWVDIAGYAQLVANQLEVAE